MLPAMEDKMKMNQAEALAKSVMTENVTTSTTTCQEGGNASAM